MAAGGSFQRQATVRNRVNQHNFRARRQAYIQELELRLQRLDNDGVRATKEVQIAAQRVDNENRLLRLLLRTQFGVSDCQLNEYLAGHICASDVCTYGFRRNADRDHPSKRLKESVSTQIIPARREQPVSAKASQESVRMGEEPPQVLVATSQYPEGEWTSIVIPASGTDSPQPLQLDSPADLLYTGIPIGLGEPSPLELEEYERDYGRGPTYSYHAPSNKKTAPGSSPSAKRADAHAGETSCVEAAKIIATLRGCNVDEDMWSELGCRAKQSCRVQNISVFELMDKA